MADIGSFDANDVKPQQDFTPIPPGKYAAMIVESDLKPNKAGTGHFLELVWEIIDGEYEGRKVWSRLNLDNPTEKAVEIARSELSSICHALDKLVIADSSELHDKPCYISVKIDQGKGDFGPSNKISGYSSVKPEKTSTTKANVVGAGKSSKPPWER